MTFMRTAIVTGSGGLIGSQSVSRLAATAGASSASKTT